jgi:hypothetical protein
MPQFTKRTPGPPSLCPIGPWSHCSTLLGSLPLQPCQDPTAHRTVQIHTLTGPPVPWALPGTSSTWDCADPIPSGFPAPRAPHPSSPTRPQLCVGLLDTHPARIPALQALPGHSNMWDCQVSHQETHPSGPCPSNPARHLPTWDSWIPTLLGSRHLETCQATALQPCQIATPPGSSLSGHHRLAPNLPEGHRQDWMLKD